MNINGDRNWVGEVNITGNGKGNLLANRKQATNQESVITGRPIHGGVQGQMGKGRTYSKADGDHVDTIRQ